MELLRCGYEGCGSVFATRSALEEHERTHTGELPFACDHVGTLHALEGLFHSRVKCAEHVRLSDPDSVTWLLRVLQVPVLR